MWIKTGLNSDDLNRDRLILGQSEISSSYMEDGEKMTCEFCHTEIDLQDRAFYVQTAQEEAACCSACLGVLAEECWTLQFKEHTLEKNGFPKQGILNKADHDFLRSMNIRW